MSFIDDIIQSFNQLKTLEIRTVIGDFDWNEEQRKITYNKEDAQVIITQIDLLDGDITTAFSDVFLQEPYDRIREFHAEREKRGQEIIENNFKVLREFVELIVNAYKAKKDVDRLEEPEP
ncbi:hypothetical protein FJZ31_40420 [Candidatus Poribacteria bacterium]|nr:hypothetical protein [Candidatus Poribacteria bacterium]